MSLAEMFFKMRGYTPFPFLLAAIILAKPQKDLIIFGIILIVFGELMRICGVSYAGGATRTRDVGAPQLVTNGPFSRLRNPLYFGNMFIYAGASIMTGAWLPYMLYLVIFFFSVQYAFIISLEEKKLSELFGEQYEKYRQEVPRFFPRISAYPNRTKIKPDFAEALRSEKTTFIAMGSFILIFIFKVNFF